MNIFSALKQWLQSIGSDNVVHYLCGSEALPLPLPPEQEAELLSKLEAGEETETVKAKLIEHNLRLVVYISRKFENTGVDADDLISIGTIGLIKAVSTFRADKSIRLATYASKCIQNELLMYFRHKRKSAGELSLSDALETDGDGNALALQDVICCEI